jgi:hypothetical protein
MTQIAASYTELLLHLFTEFIVSTFTLHLLILFAVLTSVLPLCLSRKPFLGPSAVGNSIVP